MSAAPQLKLVPEQTYLSDPGLSRFEWLDGELVERNVGSLDHGRIQGRCYMALEQFILASGIVGFAVVEPHCRLKIGGHLRYRLPDAAVVLGSDTGRYLERSPELVVEVLSPEDRLSELFIKLDDYFRNGARIAWIVLPSERSVLVFDGESKGAVKTAQDTLEGGDVLPGLAIRVSSLFPE